MVWYDISSFYLSFDVAGFIFKDFIFKSACAKSAFGHAQPPCIPEKLNLL